MTYHLVHNSATQRKLDQVSACLVCDPHDIGDRHYNWSHHEWMINRLLFERSYPLELWYFEFSPVVRALMDKVERSIKIG